VATPAGAVYQFGPFEADPVSGELQKNGEPVKLQEQPFQLLVILLQSAGEVVTREEIQQRIWRGNTFVDFDSGVRVAVRKLREALGDDAENPRYVQTIPKRGYRFLVPVTPGASSSRRRSEIGSPRALTGRSRESRRANVAVFSVAVLLVLAAAAGSSLLLKRRPVFTRRDVLVLADFVNATGDPVFDSTLRQGLAVQLEQSSFLSLVSDERVQRALRLMGQRPDVALTAEIAREVCQRTGGAAVLEGSISNLGRQYVLGLRAINCRTGDVIDQEQAQTKRKEDVLKALTQIAARFRARAGESLAEVEGHDTPLPEATTGSLEALKAYSMGWKALSSTGEDAAVPFFKRAVEIDPEFAMAHAALGLMYGATGESALSAESTKTAYELRGRTNDHERFFITASYDGRVTGNLEKTQRTCETWAQAYPRDILPHEYLSGFVYDASGAYEKAVEEAKRAIHLDPGSAIAYDILAYNYQYLGRPPQALKVLQQASARGLDIPEYIVHRYDLAFLEGDRARMEREVGFAQSQSGAEDWVGDHQAFVAAYFGRVQEARRMERRAAMLARQSDERERAALFDAGAATWEAFFGNAAAARQSAMSALLQSKDREVEYGAAFSLALSGDSGRSHMLANDLERRYPEDTSVRFGYVPVLRAIQALNKGRPQKAIELLQTATPYELGVQRSSIHANFGALYSVYVRGEAYLAANDGAQAAKEFQKILDHGGVVVSDPVGAIARLQLGRARALSRETADAKAAYRSFFMLWKGADSNIPVLKRAKVEYAKLQEYRH
jgi:eukaryotic-like serine/threonine-protein kinase